MKALAYIAALAFVLKEAFYYFFLALLKIADLFIL